MSNQKNILFVYCPISMFIFKFKFYLKKKNRQFSKQCVVNIRRHVEKFMICTLSSNIQATIKIMTIATNNLRSVLRNRNDLGRNAAEPSIAKPGIHNKYASRIFDLLEA